MELIINSEPARFEEQLTVEQLIMHQFKELPNGIAIAVNQQVVPRNEWKSFQLSNGSNILIIKATQGG
jgi:sulfur carrier protein